MIMWGIAGAESVGQLPERRVFDTPQAAWAELGRMAHDTTSVGDLDVVEIEVVRDPRGPSPRAVPALALAPEESIATANRPARPAWLDTILPGPWGVASDEDQAEVWLRAGPTSRTIARISVGALTHEQDIELTSYLAALANNDRPVA